MNQTSLIQNEDNSANIANEQFDAIVIGSGIGGLATASLLAQLEGKRVLLLERHFQIGGFTHSFSRQGGLEWDVGLHYVGEVQIGSVARAIFDFITQGQVDWQAMPDVYDRLVFPDFIHEGKVSHAFLSFPSLKNPEAQGHTAEIIAFIDVDPFISWENKPWRHRDEEYEALKERIGDAEPSQ